MKPVLFLLFPLTVFGVCSCSKSPDESGVLHRPGQPDYVQVKDEALMDRAIAQAVKTQGQFVTALASQSPGTSSFAIKKGFATPSKDDFEHIWLIDVKWDGSKFLATVNNEPVETKSVKFGDRVEVLPTEISDWMYVENRVLRGGYTIRALQAQSPPDEQAEMARQMPFEIPPLDF